MFLLVTDSLNFEGLKMHKWNVPTDKVQIVDEKNEGTQEDLSVALKCFAQAATNFLRLSAENTKRSHVLHLVKP